MACLIRVVVGHENTIHYNSTLSRTNYTSVKTGSNHSKVDNGFCSLLSICCTKSRRTTGDFRDYQKAPTNRYSKMSMVELKPLNIDWYHSTATSLSSIQVDCLGASHDPRLYPAAKRDPLTIHIPS